MILLTSFPSAWAPTPANWSGTVLMKVGRVEKVIVIEDTLNTFNVCGTTTVSEAAGYVI